MFSIRPFAYSEADYATVAGLDALLFDIFAMPADQWRHYDEIRDPALIFHRHVIEADDAVVAVGEYGHCPWAFHPRKFRMLLMVHPDHDDPAIRPLYYDLVMQAAADHDLVAVQAALREDKAADMQFFQQKGFTLALRLLRSVLDVTVFDAAAFDDVLQNVAGQGIVIKPLPELQATDPDWLPKLRELHWALVQDIPAMDPPRKKSEEEFVKERLESPEFTADGLFVALDGGRYIGLSQIWLDTGDTTNLQGGLTGVRREYRRQGIATALKVHLIKFAQEEYGAQTINTYNEENNPMFDLNVQLGFVARPAWVEYEKALQVEE